MVFLMQNKYTNTHVSNLSVSFGFFIIFDLQTSNFQLYYKRNNYEYSVEIDLLWYPIMASKFLSLLCYYSL